MPNEPWFSLFRAGQELRQARARGPLRLLIRVPPELDANLRPPGPDGTGSVAGTAHPQAGCYRRFIVPSPGDRGWAQSQTA